MPEESAYKALMRDPGTSLSSERILFLHVLAQALIDTTVGNKEVRKEAVDWIGTEDFEAVCDFAGTDVQEMHRLFRKVSKMRNKKKAFAMAMHFRFTIRTYIDRHIGKIDKQRAIADQ